MVRVLRSAHGWGRRPTELLGCPWHEWSQEDTQLILAFDAYELERLDEYGFPRWLSEGDTEGWFEVVETQNNARLAMDYYRRDHKDGPPSGIIPRVIYTGTMEQSIRGTDPTS